MSVDSRWVYEKRTAEGSYLKLVFFNGDINFALISGILPCLGD